MQKLLLLVDDDPAELRIVNESLRPQRMAAFSINVFLAKFHYEFTPPAAMGRLGEFSADNLAVSLQS